MKLRVNSRYFSRTVLSLGTVSIILSLCLTSVSSQKKENAAAKKGELTPFNPQKTVLVDVEGKRVLLKTKVVLREGMLEMLCCLKQTKEHESILSLDAKAYIVNTALIAVGAKPGKPVQFYPKYISAKGQKIDIFLQWKDKKGKHHRVKAKRWIRHGVTRYFAEKLDPLPNGLKLPRRSGLFYDDAVKELTWFGHMTKAKRDELLKFSENAEYQKKIQSLFTRTKIREMDTEWIYTGSQLFDDRRNGKKVFAAEGGYLVCVSNFPAAMIDVKVKSSANENDLLYEPFTERIPPLDTEVTIELIPVTDTKKKSK